jgi:hypothetical protein
MTTPTSSSSAGLIHMAPYDGFTFANSKATDLMVRTPTTTQRILISPQQASDAVAATLTIDSQEVNVAGSIAASGTVTSADVDTIGIRLRRGTGGTGLVVGGGAQSILAQIGRLRIGVPEGPILLDHGNFDVYLLTEQLLSTISSTTFSLPSDATVNGRRLTIKNVSAATPVTIDLLRPTAGSTTMAVVRTIALPAGASKDLYGYMDEWQ